MIKLQDELLVYKIKKHGYIKKFHEDETTKTNRIKFISSPEKKLMKFLWKFPTVKAKSIVMHCWHLSRNFVLKKLSSFDEV